MTITMTVESPEEAAKVVAIAEAMRHQEQGPPIIPTGKIGFARPPVKEPWAEEAEVVPIEFSRECAGDGE
jgi:hypothetical protein